jgi:pyruvate, orthophosphate dikinase
MDTRIHFFSQNISIPSKVSSNLLGIRGRQANEFAELAFPILPGIILDTEIASDIDVKKIKKDISELLGKCAKLVAKTYGDPKNPMLLKVVISSNLAITNYPTLHNFGLVKPTIDGFAKWVGEDFAASEVLFLINGMMAIQERIKELEGKTKEKDEISGKIKIIKRLLGIKGPSNELHGKEEKTPEPKKKSAKEYMEEYGKYFPKGFFDDAEGQLLLTLGEISRMLSIDEQNDNDTAIMIQPMVYGNYGKDSCAGGFYSRNVVTGEKKLQGSFFRNKFNEIGAEGHEINKIDAVYLKQMEKIAWTLEDKFKEIRYVRFTVENGKLWLIEQRLVDQKSTQADLKLLLDLQKRKIVDEAYVIKGIDPIRLNEILHPIINMSSVKAQKSWKGGIAGAPGAAIGQVYFSTDSLLEAKKQAAQKGKDGRFILVVESSFAEDVKAIEVSTGVLTAEGGYSAHASVVARQYGKVSLVSPELKIKGNKASLGGDFNFSEGDYITINVPFYGESTVYEGVTELIEPNPKESGLLDFITLSKKFVKGFHIRCNADTPRDAALALSFGADGLGLCRTEHMFFKEDRINVFRDMLLSDDTKERQKYLDKLEVMQREDFYSIMKVMAGKEVTIRLLDSPLHEFMPHNSDELNSYVSHASQGKTKLSKADITARIDALHEFNPMLGHRGCRIAVSYPEIYAMQVRAIFKAAYKLRSEKIDARPEIMVPIVMNVSELKLIAYGKKIEGSNYLGIVDIEEALRKELKAKEVDYKIGTMIELPAAALGAGEIARYGRFFSFGTNDLTQTTLGISRDDFTAFMPDYTLFDLINGNPFSTLDTRVKELITIATDRGRITRPDLVCGLCGEHGANPANVRFCMEAGLNYVSCSPYSVPIALLAVAQAEIEKLQPKAKE